MSQSLVLAALTAHTVLCKEERKEPAALSLNGTTATTAMRTPVLSFVPILFKSSNYTCSGSLLRK